MYEVFDSYLDVDTWYSGHDLDRQRFMKALATVAGEIDFNPDKMGRYMRRKERCDR